MTNYSESRQPIFVSLLCLVNKYLPKLHVDKTFQRRVCWDLEQKQSYIINILRQHEAGTFSFADVKTGLQRSQADGDAASEKRYQDVKDLGKEIISLDAQNRGIAVQEFFNNKFGITTEFILNGQVYNLDNCRYDDLPVAVRAQLDHSQMIVIVFESFLYSSLNRIFLSINDGLPMVDQEKRNSIATWISTTVLDDAENKDKYQKVLSRVVKPEAIQRMGEVELLVKVLIATHKTFAWTSTNVKTLDNFYKLGDGKTRSDVAEYDRRHMDRFYKIMNYVKQFLDDPKHKNLQSRSGDLPNQTFWTTVLIAEYLVDNDLTIKKDKLKGFDIAIYDLDKHLVDKAEQLRVAHQISYDNKERDEEPKNSEYYDNWVSLPHQKHALQKRRKHLTEHFAEKYKEILVPKVQPIRKVASNG